MSKRVVVAGGAGFIGSHLAWYLMNRGHEVVVLDNLSSGRRENVPNRATFYHCDARDFIDLGDCDEIYNLACIASPKLYQRRRIGTLTTCFEATKRLLHHASAVGAKFLQASTSEIYGDPAEHPQCEEYVGHVNPIGPRSCYDEGKRVAEALVMAYIHERQTSATIARIFNTYGPGMQLEDGRVVSNFIAQALAGRPLTIYGDGQQTRSFCFVEDMVRGLVAAMESQYSGPVNLGNPEETTILSLAKMIIQSTGSRSTLEWLDLPEDDPRLRCPDISRARQILGWNPSTSLGEGLTRTILHFREYH